MSESGGNVHVTVVDESLTVAQAAQRVFPAAGIKTSFAGTLYELPLVFAANGMPDLLVVSLSEELTGWEVTALVRRTGYRGRILAFVDSLADTGVRHLSQLRRGECVVRPPTDASLDDLLRRALPESLLAQPGPPEMATPAAYHGIIGSSPQMREIFSRIEKVAAGDANVCIHGESGTGKELIARAIHYASPRRDRPLITLDCTTIPEGLMESHLLGHVRGAFTGAVEHREGVFSLAHTGTLFIDELSEL